MTTISTRPKSPTRAEAIAKALRPAPVFCTGVLLGNWVENRIECPKRGTFYFPPKEDIDYEKLKPESRQPDFRLNKLNSLQGNVHSVIRHDSHDSCGNFATTTDLVYKHLPKPLCGPNLRYYKRSAHQFYPQPELMKCFGNATEWGLKNVLQSEWACADTPDYCSTLYEDTYVPPMPCQYLQRSERKARNSGSPDYENKYLSKHHVSIISGNGCACVLPQSVGTSPFIYIDNSTSLLLVYSISFSAFVGYNDHWHSIPVRFVSVDSNQRGVCEITYTMNLKVDGTIKCELNLTSLRLAIYILYSTRVGLCRLMYYFYIE